MRRAVQQAKAEAAAAAKSQAVPLADKQLAPVGAQVGKAKRAGGDKRSLAAMLTKVAQKMQEQEAATSSDPASTSLATATAQAVSELIVAESNTQDEPVDPGDLQLSSVSRASSSNSVDRLLFGEPKGPPSRSQSLGERLGAMLRGALSIPRQFSYAPIAGDDQRLLDDSASFDLLPPVRRRALPRDASYLPEWLNQTFGTSPGRHGRNETDLASGTEELLQEPADDDIDLPQWVDWSTIQPDKEAPPVKWRPAPLTLPTDEPSVSPLMSDSKPVAELTVPTPKGQRLFEFWRQRSAAARSTSAVDQAMYLPPPLTSKREEVSVPPQTAQRTSASSDSGQGADTNLRQLHALIQSDNEPSAGNARQSEIIKKPLQPRASTAELAAELAATSQLVHQQSLQQAELLQGLEHALSELSQHRLLIQNPTAQPEASQETAPEGIMLALSAC